MRHRALLIGFLLGAGFAAADLPQTLERCAARLDPVRDAGHAAIASRCPELMATLASSAAADWLPPGWRDD
ncbi:MAG: hypothetical protein RML32_04470, partial [Gammaproteobacteria bacterium]|nr:hypothetical protein [Gammaproteobacteria bacterium]